jgi:predicted nucleic acid-binding protein
MTEFDLTPWALDACAAINFAAVLPVEEFSTAMSVNIVAVRQAASESQCLHDYVDGEKIRTPIDLRSLTVLDLAEPEFADYVALSAHMDDGEAATLALAHGRSFIAVTDDKKARKWARVIVPAVRIIGTASAFQRYAGLNSLSADEIRERLLTIQRRARFRPPREDEDYEWWHRHCTR